MKFNLFHWDLTG